MCYDMAHVLAVYPRLGYLDTCFHHASYAAAALVAGVSRSFPFAFGWCALAALRAKPDFVAKPAPLQAHAVRSEHAVPQFAVALQVRLAPDAAWRSAGALTQRPLRAGR